MTNEETKNLEKNIKKHIDIVLEHMDEKFAVVLEGQKIIKDDVKVIKQDVELLKEDMDYVKSEIVEIKDRFKEVDAELDKKADKEVVSGHETRITNLENTALAKA